MPVIEVTLMEGYPEATRQALLERLTDAVTHTIAAPLEGVTVIIQEVPAANYMRGRQRRVPGVAKSGTTLYKGRSFMGHQVCEHGPHAKVARLGACHCQA